MTDLVILLSKLVTPDGKILVPGINDDVAELTGKLFKFYLSFIYLFANKSLNIRLDEEKKTYESIDFKLHELHSAIESQTNLFDDEIKTLQAR
jgi:Cys-Gly metallodipeptidase DUG1